MGHPLRLGSLEVHTLSRARRIGSLEFILHGTREGSSRVP